MHRRRRPSWRLAGALAVAAWLLWAPAARAATPGEAVADVLAIGGKQVPLLPGRWVVAATGTQPADAGQAPFGVVRYAVLLLRDGDQVRALMEVNTNDIPVRGGWASPCGNDPLPPQLRLRYRSAYDASCAEAGRTRLNPAGPPAWQAARAGIERARLQLPDIMSTAMALCADRQNFVEVRVHLRATPGVDEAVQQRTLLDWAATYASLVALGLSRRLDGLVLDWPGRAGLLQDSPVLDRRLLRIEALRRAGAITADQANAQEMAALAEAPMSAADPNPRTTLYMRLSSPLINFGTAYSVTWNAPLSLAIAASEDVARRWLAFANERRWTAFAREVMPVPSPMPPLAHLGSPVTEAGPSGLVAIARSGLADLYQ